jgi:DNA polymerase III subunit epsilon
VSKLAFVDLETTGMSFVGDRIIEVGILVLENGKIRRKYKTLIDPDERLNPYITTITGLTNEDLQGAPSFHQVADEIMEILNGCVFVAHNVRFDYGFLKAELERAGHEFKPPHFCTAKLSRLLNPEHKRHGLDYLIERHKIQCANRHRAFDDAQAICKFYKLMVKAHGQQKIDQAVAQVSRRVSWPAGVPREEIEALPHCPGVYVFYGENNSPLYVGKSLDIKSRVLSHFSGDLESMKEMKLTQQVRRIVALPTAGELGALVKESQMVKELMPLHNRRLRKSYQLVALRACKGEDGYYRIKIFNTNEENIAPDDIEEIYGIFRTKGQAVKALMNLSDEHGICRKLLGLEKTTKNCFGYQLKKCAGACAGKEPAALFNARFEIAFMNMRFRKWPYAHPVRVMEQNETLAESYIIDRWCLFKSDETGQAIAADLRFDLDVYKILKSYLLNPQNRKSIALVV